MLNFNGILDIMMFFYRKIDYFENLYEYTRNFLFITLTSDLIMVNFRLLCNGYTKKKVCRVKG